MTGNIDDVSDAINVDHENRPSTSGNIDGYPSTDINTSKKCNQPTLMDTIEEQKMWPLEDKRSKSVTKA